MPLQERVQHPLLQCPCRKTSWPFPTSQHILQASPAAGSGSVHTSVKARKMSFICLLETDAFKVAVQGIHVTAYSPFGSPDSAR